MTPSASISIQRQCNFCSHWLPPSRVHQLHLAQTICDYCLEWHLKALEVLAGISGSGCQGCGLSWEELKARFQKGQRLWVVPKDGIYQLLCKACVDPYLPKRADLYRDTPFGKGTLKL